MSIGKTGYKFSALLLTALLVFGMTALADGDRDIELIPIGNYSGSAAEISAYDPDSERLFITKVENGIDVVDVSDPESPVFLFTIDISPYGAIVNSVAVHDELLAAAIENTIKQEPGVIVFFDTDGNFLKQVTAGALPDMVTFSPDGRYVLTANEGEPSDDYTNDPEGSVTIVDLRRGLNKAKVETATFRRFNNKPLDPSIRIFGPGATVAQDLEPEYIAVSENSKYAYVTCQENNAIAVVDIKKAKVTDLYGLGFKNHSKPGNALDASDRDNGINIQNWPVYGMYLPDAIAHYRTRGKDYLVTANEGDARDYGGFAEEERIKDVTLDPTAFPNAADLQADANLGRLNITTTLGDTDNDGDYDKLFSYGARSFTIWSDEGEKVFDSGDEFEQLTKLLVPDIFNSDGTAASFDGRSDNKGPEPEGLVIGEVSDRYYAFIGLERIGGVMVYDITKPNRTEFVQYINTNAAYGDIAPEGLVFISKKDSPTRRPLLVVTHEVSGSTTIFEIKKKRDHDLAQGAEPDAATVEEKTEKAVALHQNYPNPFNPATAISFSLPSAQRVRLSIYNVTGQLVATLIDRSLEAGEHTYNWDAGNLASGMYIYRLETGQTVQIRKMMLLK